MLTVCLNLLPGSVLLRFILVVLYGMGNCSAWPLSAWESPSPKPQELGGFKETKLGIKAPTTQQGQEPWKEGELLMHWTKSRQTSKRSSWDFPHGPGVETLQVSTARGAGSIPGLGSSTYHAAKKKDHSVPALNPWVSVSSSLT